MISKSTSQAIKDKEMDRKGFLKYTGLLVLSLVGLKTVISLLSQTDNNKIVTSKQGRDIASVYGNSGYGK